MKKETYQTKKIAIVVVIIVAHDMMCSARHGFMNPRGYLGMGMVGAGTGQLGDTRSKPTPA